VYFVFKPDNFVFVYSDKDLVPLVAMSC